MPAKQNREIVRRLFNEIWSKGNMEAAQEIVAPDFQSDDSAIRFHGTTNGGFEVTVGPRALELERELYLKKVSELHFDIQEMIAAKDRVIAFWTARGDSRSDTFTDRGGNLRKKELNGSGMSVSRIVDGKIKSNTMYWSREQSLV
jgi:SnoaL-like polyketide cyclase